jgi:hypothetical protein
MDAFPVLGGKPVNAIQIGAWGDGIKPVVAAKNLPDPMIAQVKAEQDRACWLRKQEARACIDQFANLDNWDTEYVEDGQPDGQPEDGQPEESWTIAGAWSE